MARTRNDNKTSVQSCVSLNFDRGLLQQIVAEVIREVATDIDWPAGRIAISEVEAAEALGVRRHVLRDLRLSGRISATRLGRSIMYTRRQLFDALDHCAEVRQT